MARINVLDKHTAELIAAGEVVERPASVIKELTENSIDAGATAITVEIRNGGISYMRVTDNGCGIMREDVPKAFLRHATSKVKTEDDLDKISTLGFRGEALASISAVARVELLTHSEDEEDGTLCTIEGGDNIEIHDAGCPKGTTITVKDLFYNIPARMKFLKKDVTEGTAVAGIMDKLALSHPEVAISFIREGKKVMSTAGDGKLMSAIYGVYGSEFAKTLIPVDYTVNDIRVSGYISKPENARPTRGMQSFFLNGRFVKSRTAMAALEEACKGSVMVGKYPSCVLHIDMSFNAVDVNVHPAKTEVRFTNERPVFDAVYHAVKTALLSNKENRQIELSPTPRSAKPFKSPIFDQITKAPEKKPLPIKQEKIIEKEEPIIYTPPTPKKEEKKPLIMAQEPPLSQQSTILNDIAVTRPTITPFVVQMPEKEEKPLPLKQEKILIEVDSENQYTIEKKEDKLTIIGEAFKTYIIMQKNDDELLIVDKHAAHERLIYEKLKKERSTFAQMLLSPVSVLLDKDSYSAILNNLPELNEAGYEVEDFGSSTVVVHTAPQYISASEVEDSIIEIAGYLLKNKKDITTEKIDWIFHNTACRAAIKGGQISHNSELEALVCELMKNEDVRHCPHGRPIYTVLKKRELEKNFFRIV